MNLRPSLPFLSRPWALRLALGLVLLQGGPSTLLAKLIEPQGLVLKILEQTQGVSQFQVEVNYRVFDPEAVAPLSEPTLDQNPVSELPQFEFSQKVVLVKDVGMVSQITEKKGQLLHLTIAKEGRQQEKNLDPKRPFSKADAAFLPALLFPKAREEFLTSLTGLGINPTQVGTEVLGYNILYRLGGPDDHLLIDPKTFRVLAIRQTVLLDGRAYPLQVLFLGNLPGRPELPQMVRYYLGGRLFKEGVLGKYTNKDLPKELNRLFKESEHH